ncbi:MAG: VapE domain-containing protein, partial [Polyangiales bacterium]
VNAAASSDEPLAATAAVVQLLKDLPMQALMHEGGALVTDQVTGAIKASNAKSLGKTAVRQAVAEFSERLVRRATASEDSAPWRSDLRRSASGKVENSSDNLLSILANDPAWKDVVGYDEFADRVVFRRSPPWDRDDAPKAAYRANQELSDADDFRMTAWLSRHYEIKITTQTAHSAICTTAYRNIFHPVRDYLRAIKWDGVKRLGSRDDVGWLTTFLGAEDKRYTRITGRMWMISAVARIMKPGCLVKTMIVLCGPQDAKKSQAFRALGGDWYMDDLRDLHSKDTCQQLAGKWIVEMGEMAAWGKADAETGKRFVSTCIDRYRSAYERCTHDVPRQSVFGGSSNPAAFLADVTGGARFWPVDVGTIDIAALRAARDQLWAEAVAAYDAGEKWWTEDTEEVADLRVEQEERRRRHPWEDVLAKAFAEGTDQSVDTDGNIIDVPRKAMSEVTMIHVLDTILRIPVERRTRTDETTAGECLHALGWTKRRRRIEGRREYYYRQPEAVPTGPTWPTSIDDSKTYTAISVASAPSDSLEVSDIGRDGKDSRDVAEKQPLEVALPPVEPGNDGQDGGDTRPWERGSRQFMRTTAGTESVFIELHDGIKALHKVPTGSPEHRLYRALEGDRLVEVQLDPADRAHVIAVRPVVEESEAAE